jgi:YebC/PmpR family DNA-binding regulatory protein
VAGHSRWAQIKRQKAVTDSKRGAAFAKISKVIMIAVRTGGGPDPKYNFKLKTAIDKAKAADVPRSNIERAIEKASGADADHNIKEVVYEGYLPGGVAVMVFAATDNSNRTYSDIRLIFTKAEGSLGSSGCVAYLFKKQGLIKLAKPANFNQALEDELLQIAVEAGADDMNNNTDEITIKCNPEALEKISENFEQLLKNNTKLSGVQILEVKDELEPENTVTVSNPEDAKNILKAMHALDDNDDVVDVVANFDIADNLSELF